jgi:L-asparaginase / beta-aspartyl-peptidase
MNTHKLAVIIHGGAGTLPHAKARKKLPGLQKARDAAWRVLEQGKPGIEAVEAALRVLEDDQHFNAGYGSYPDERGRIVMDVGVMQGDRSFSSYLNVERVRFPSSLAVHRLRQEKRSLMTVWTSDMMHAVESLSKEEKAYLGVAETHEQLLAPFVQELIEHDESEIPMRTGTVGCVVRDGFGQLCAGTSTGGLTGKPDGRVGDSPIVGSGVYADSEIGALSTTGTGESFLGSAVSGLLLAEMRRELSKSATSFVSNPNALKSLIETEITELTRKYGRERGGAIIAMPPSGRPAFGFNTDMLSLGYKSLGDDGSCLEDVCIAFQSGEFLRA